MEIQINPYEPEQLDTIIRLSLQAWTPVFESIQNVMDFDVYQELYPDDWRISQQKAVESVCRAEDSHLWVSDSGSITGFVAVKCDPATRMGEIYMVAVAPDFQGRGIGSALIQFALGWMKEAGMSVAMVETGGDPGHAPARYTYEKLGFRLLPIARYFKKL